MKQPFSPKPKDWPLTDKHWNELSQTHYEFRKTLIKVIQLICEKKGIPYQNLAPSGLHLDPNENWPTNITIVFLFQTLKALDILFYSLTKKRDGDK